MTRFILVACAAGLFALLGGTASAQQASWSGIVDITKTTTSAGGCGASIGEKHVVQYRPFITGSDPASAIVMDMGGATIYVLNRDATSQFQGTGSTLSTIIVTDKPDLLNNVHGSYNITFSPDPIAANTSTIQISSGTLNLNIPGGGICVFKFRGILTPAP